MNQHQTCGINGACPDLAKTVKRQCKKANGEKVGGKR
jgi:hypothetical protein